jgi:hypothetical protein
MLVLHKLFIDTLNMEPPRTLSKELIFDTLQNYKDSDSTKVHDLVHEIAYEKLSLRPE